MRSSVAKVAFVGALMVFSFLYGFGAREWGWFPNSLIEQAWRQAKVVAPFEPPNFVNSRVCDRQGARQIAPEEIQPGLTLVTSMWEGPDEWGPEVRLMHRSGQTVHRWRLDSRSLFPDSLDQRRIGRRYIHGSHLEPDGTLLVNFGQVGTVQVDACSRPQWRLAIRSHHSIERTEDGTYWIPGSSKTPRRTLPTHPDGVPGLDKPVYHEPIVHISTDGSVLDRLNVLDLLYANDMERYIAEASSPRRKTKGPRRKTSRT